jgi:hypothetical protein
VDPTWTFERDGERLVMQRRTDPELALVILSGESARHVPFTEMDALTVFEKDMQEFLIRTGWSLADFAPERRSYRDRRGFPRTDNDRRRWWSDANAAFLSSGRDKSSIRKK